MIADTSAWVEFLRGTGSPVHLRLRAQIADEAPLLVPELVIMELLTGVSDGPGVRRLRTLLHTFEVVAIAPLVDSEDAANLQRRCRASGRTVRNMIDCLIAAMAIRRGDALLHLDRDFEALASVSDLQLVTP